MSEDVRARVGGGDGFQWPPATGVRGSAPVRSEPVPMDDGAGSRGAPADAGGGWRRADRAREGAGSSLDVDAGLFAPEGAWHAVEETFLGLVRPPLVVRARVAGWMPDEPRAYCARCGGGVGSFEADATGCPRCAGGGAGGGVAWARAVRLGEYEGLLREMIHDVKFAAWRVLGEELGALLGSAVCDAAERAGVERSRLVIVPVPTTLWRRLSRGVDHTRAIARGVGRVCGAEVMRALGRWRRPPQVGLPVGMREMNVRGSMWARRVDLRGMTVVVVDDVRTTGATLREACRALGTLAPEDRPASVWGATLAVVTEGMGSR